MSRLVKKSYPSGQVYLAQIKRQATLHRMDHLACFAGGWFVLGAQTVGGPHKEEWMKVGADITETCHMGTVPC